MKVKSPVDTLNLDDLRQDELIEIALHLDIRSVAHMCQENRKISKHCTDDFWTVYLDAHPEYTQYPDWSVSELVNLHVFLEALREMNPKVELDEQSIIISDELSLEISNNQITTIPKEIKNLTNLEILDLSNNQITEIPNEINKLSKLTFLSMAGNKITKIPDISNLTNLEVLDFSDNKIMSFPQGFDSMIEEGGLDNLMAIYLRNNKIDQIPYSIVRLTGLGAIDLTGNPISFSDLEVAELIFHTPTQSPYPLFQRKL